VGVSNFSWIRVTLATDSVSKLVVFRFVFCLVCRGLLCEIRWYWLVVFCVFCLVMVGSTVVLVMSVAIDGVFVAC